MKRIQLLASAVLLCCIGLSASAKGRVMKSPTCLLRTNTHVSVSRVEFTDTATVVFLHAEGKAGESIGHMAEIFAYDEDGERYALGNAREIPYHMDSTGRLDIRLSFQPLPVKTRVFDVITDWPGSPFSFYGIGYGAKRKPAARHTVQELSAAEKALEESLWQSGTVVVRGRIDGVDTMAVSPVVSFPYPCPFLYREWDGLAVNGDGTFELSAVLGHPSLANVSLYAGRGCSFTTVMLTPGDTVTLDIPRLHGNDTYTIGYSSGRHYDLLLLHYPKAALYGWHSGERLLGKMDTPADIFVSTQSREAQLHDFCDYVTGKFAYSPDEAVLLRKCIDHALLSSRVSALQQYCLQERGHRPYDGLTEAQAEAAAKYLETALDDLTLFLDSNPLDHELRSFGVQTAGFFHPDGLAGDYLQADSIYRAFFHFAHSPLMLQASILGEQVNHMGRFEPGSRVESTKDRLREVVGSPFLRSRLDGMVDRILLVNREVSRDVSQRQGYDVLDSLTSMHRGKIVCLLTLADDEADRTEAFLDNLVEDYRESPDVALVFVADSTRMTSARFADIRHDIMGDYPYFYRLTPNEYTLLALLAGNPQGHLSGITLDRDGKELRNTLLLNWSADSETMFRRELRKLVKGQPDTINYSLY